MFVLELALASFLFKTITAEFWDREAIAWGSGIHSHRGNTAMSL